MNELIINAVLIGALAVATVTDLRARRIPNALTLGTFAAGFVLTIFTGGFDGLRLSAQGAGLALAMFLPMYVFRGLGAGDVKLMAAIGALKGPEFVLFTFAWAALFGGAMAIAGLLRSRKMTLAFAHLFFFKFFPRPDGTFITAGRMPYAPAIALGATLALGGVRWIQV